MLPDIDIIEKAFAELDPPIKTVILNVSPRQGLTATVLLRLGRFDGVLDLTMTYVVRFSKDGSKLLGMP